MSWKKPRFRWTPEQIDEFRRLWHSDLSIGEIAEYYGVSIKTVRYHGRKLYPGVRGRNASDPSKYRRLAGRKVWDERPEEEKATLRAHMANVVRTGRPHPQTPETRERISQLRKKSFRAERARITYGLPQKTRLIFSMVDPVLRKRRINLSYRMRRDGYEVDGLTIYLKPDDKPIGKRKSRSIAECGFTVTTIDNKKN